MKKRFQLALIGATILSAVALVGCFDEGVAEPEVLAFPVESYTPLNDTGITACGDYAYGAGSGIHNNTVDCVAVGSTQTNSGAEAANGFDLVEAGQDAIYGRDVTHNDNRDGHAGFSFTKLDANGDELAVSAANWSCVKDNVTGLIWEVKTDDGGLQDKGHTYTWYNSTGVNDGGDHGVGDTGAGTTTGLENSGNVYAGSDNCANSARCDTEKYVADVNAANLCGADDWRLPTSSELKNIVSRDRANPAIDTAFFPNTQSSYYWSSSPYAYYPDFAWVVYYYDGSDSASSKFNTYNTNYVRLVRASQ